MWTILTTELFDHWFERQDELTQNKMLAGLLALRKGGPNVGRPLVDAIKFSRWLHMKELRVQHKGQPIRAFFAFDPLRRAIILCAGDKSGNDKRFYREMLAVADAQYAQHLMTLVE
ncbi:hypothetical protein J2125_002071 [Erwinia toletana]|uniref:Addiction module toxin RelE n=1 Tax=Winslowiella toletana TaxID=92490 RepID=A0ABS4P8B6_9GAMM|nr:type II toxin-antitoxin system RelE/ParE family toxin [Winslowiella toletana]MBP2168879.1 hypothetical protein [Winslowiella toletana]